MRCRLLLASIAVAELSMLSATHASTSFASVDITPSGWTYGGINGGVGSLQIGTVAPPESEPFTPCLWTNGVGVPFYQTPPSGYSDVSFFISRGGQTVGFGTTTLGAQHALLLQGSTLTDLNPAGATSSSA